MTRVAVVGTGFGCLTHVRALRAAGFEVTALVGRDPEKTAARAQRFEIDRPATALADVFDVCDAVTVATPPLTHGPLVLEAVGAGKHVLCEKPFARDASEARSLLHAAEQASVVHLLGTEFRFAPGRVLFADAIRDGLIGEPRLATFLLHIPLLAGANAEVPDWWSDVAQLGGWLGAQGSHDVDQIRTALGEFAGVSASLLHVGGHDWTAEDGYVVHFRLRNGCTGVMQSVASDRGPMLFATRVAGTTGAVWAEGDRVQVADADGTRELAITAEIAVGAADPPPADLMHTTYDWLHSTGMDMGPYTRLCETFRALIEGKPIPRNPAPATFADGVKSMEVLDAIRASAAVGGAYVEIGVVTGVVVCGTGFGCFTHVRALRNAGFEVLALVGRDPEKTAARAEIFEVPHAPTSFADALAMPGVDAVTIATPPHTHAELVHATLAARKHVLCEKPLARDTAEARELHAAADQAGVVHLLGTEFRFDTGQALLSRAVHDGLVGEPRLVTVLMHVPMLAEADADVPAWWADDAQGGGWLGAHGSQVIDQIRVTAGDFASVSASAVRVSESMAADTGFVVHFRLRNGAAGVMQSTAADRGPMLVETRVAGTDGAAWIEGVGAKVFVADADGTRRLEIPAELQTLRAEAPPAAVLNTTYEQMTGHGMDLGPYTRLAEHFRARITGTEPPPGPAPATFADGVAAMEVLDACRTSSAEQRTVPLA